MALWLADPAAAAPRFAVQCGGVAGEAGNCQCGACSALQAAETHQMLAGQPRVVAAN